MIDLTGRPVTPASNVRRRFLDALERATTADDGWASPPALGAPALREALSHLTGTAVDDIVVTGGARAAAAWLLTGRARLLVEVPTFLGVPAVASAMGLEVVRASWADIPERVRPGDCVWVTSPARNPDGRRLDEATAVAIGEAATACDALVVQNLAYRWFEEGRDVVRVPASLAAGTFAKITGGGTRLGWVDIGSGPPPRACAPVQKPPHPWQLAWAEVLGDESVMSTLDERNIRIPARAAVAFANALGLERGDTSGPSMVLVSGPTDESMLVAELHRSGVAVGRGADFACPRPSVRVSFSTSSVSEAIEAGEIVAAVLRRRGVSPRALQS